MTTHPAKKSLENGSPFLKVASIWKKSKIFKNLTEIHHCHHCLSNYEFDGEYVRKWSQLPTSSPHPHAHVVVLQGGRSSLASTWPTRKAARPPLQEDVFETWPQVIDRGDKADKVCESLTDKNLQKDIIYNRYHIERERGRERETMYTYIIHVICHRIRLFSRVQDRATARSASSWETVSTDPASGTAMASTPGKDQMAAGHNKNGFPELSQNAPQWMVSTTRFTLQNNSLRFVPMILALWRCP